MKTIKLNALIITVLLLGAINLNAQINLKEKLKNKANDRANQRVDEGIDKSFDAVENGVKNSSKKKEQGSEDNEEQTSDQSSEQKSTNDKSNPLNKPKFGAQGNVNNSNNNSGSTSTSSSAQTPTLKSATKYDFVPGDKVILYEDFSQDEIGDFPALWTTNGSGEVRTLNLFPGKWLYLNARDKVYHLMKDLTLPDNFIFEFDIVPQDDPSYEGAFSLYFTLYNGNGEYLDDALYPGTGGLHITCKNEGWEGMGYKEGATETTSGSSELAPVDLSKSNHVIVWVQKRRLRIYHKGQKALDLPTIMYDGVKINRLRFSLWGGQGLAYISNLRFTTAKPDMRSKLFTEGKIVSYGIYFDVNSDKVKSESYGTLKEIAAVLTENPAVRIQIVGHTDGDGDAAKNLDLSKRRAASVKNELSTTFGIAATRIETDGKGKTQPIAGNDTPANKAQNRRVEFIKL
jgi:outer membrane protein OmpA-like peptidoglycan-associated protein